MYARSRTTTIRAVVWDSSQNRIYMNDGTVWAPEPDSAQFDVKPLVGDTVRYVHTGNRIVPLESLDAPGLEAPSWDTCDLNDVTIGTSYLAARISSPFTHSSCPER